MSDHVDEHTAAADAASLRARVAALEACLRDVLAAIDRSHYLRQHEAVLRARALLDVGGGR